MEKGLLRNIVFVGFSLLCLACIAGIALVLYDVVAAASGSPVSGYGIVAVFVMALAFAGRYLWESRQAGG